LPLLGERTVEERSGESAFPLPSLLGWATFLVALGSLQSGLRAAVADLTSLFVPKVPEGCLGSTFSGLLGLKRGSLEVTAVVFRVTVLVFCSGVSFCFAIVGSSGSFMRGLSYLGDDLLSNRARSVTSFPLPSPGDVVL